MSKKLLVSIDGGGELITGPAAFFVELEREIGSLNQKATAWSGASAGALYALARCIGMEAPEAQKLIDNGNPRIFHSVPLWWKLDPTRPKWQEDGLEKILLDVFGDHRCSDIQTPFYVSSFNFDTGKPKIWDNTDSELVRNVARMSSAAPTYFSITPSRNSDGGLVANNMSLCGIAGMRTKQGIPADDIMCLSMDTGGGFWKRPSLSPRTTKLGWIEPVIHACMYGGEEMVEYITDAWIGDRHLRVSPNLSRDYEMDDSASLPEYREKWLETYKDNGEVVRLFLHGLES